MKLTQRIHRFPALLAGLVLAGACSSATVAPREPQVQRETQVQPGTQSAAELEALYRARVDSARSRFTPADVRFMSNMIHHHAQALDMAGLAAERTVTPSIRTLAARIINAQKDEIGLMQQWLRDRGQPAPEVHTMDGRVMVHGSEHPHDMPGLVTPAQMAQLEAARGAEFDRLFLVYMIDHHRGAVTMVHALFATDGAAQDNEVFKFASDVQVDQTTEVARMESMLEAMQDGGARR